MFRNVQEIRSQLGDVRAPTRLPHVMVLHFDADIAANGNATKEKQNDAGWVFAVSELSIIPYIPSAATAIAGTPLPDESSPTAASNTFPTKSLVQFRWRSQASIWVPEWTPVLALAGDGPNPAYWPDQPIIAAGEKTQIDILNASALTIRVWCILKGTRFKV